jgi:hypothetical protein
MLKSLLAICACCSVALAAPLPKATFKKLKDYFPLAKGNKWVYESGTSEIVVEVTECEEEKDGTKTAKLATMVQGKEVASETIQFKKEGLFRSKVNDTEVTPPVQIMKFDKEDEQWVMQSKIGTTETKYIIQHRGEEKIDTKAGSYTAVQVVIQATIGQTETEVAYWFVEDVGIAQLEYKIGKSASAYLKLKSFTPGKEK